MENNLRERAEKLLEGTGVAINGKNPWDLQVNNDKFYARVISEGSMGLGESYMDGWWDCERIDEMVVRFLRSKILSKIEISPALVKDAILARVINFQNKKRAFNVGIRHYDIGNDLYKIMLDKYMTYTCGYWKNARTLDKAQEAKLRLVCEKIGLKPGDRVLDIGCGWGSFAKFAAKNYKASVVGVTVSKEQVALGKELCAGLPVELRLQDYRDINPSKILGPGKKFDHIVSLGMFEHVGDKNYREFFEVANRCLEDDGLFLLHTIGGNRSIHSTDPWLDKYIFPGGMLPSISQIGKAIEKLFVMEDWHNFSTYYDKTLMAWHENFESGWDEIKNRYDERFHRMWRYYLLVSAATFRSRDNQLWQIVLSKKGVKGGYVSIR